MTESRKLFTVHIERKKLSVIAKDANGNSGIDRTSVVRDLGSDVRKGQKILD